MTANTASDHSPGAALAPQVERPSDLDLQQVEPRFHASVRDAVDLLTRPTANGTPWVVTPLPGGASNLNFRIDADGQTYALRVCGGDIDRRVSGGTRAHGAEIQRAVAAGGVGAPLYAYALPQGHLLAGFVEGATSLDVATLRSDHLIERMARLVRQLHDLPPITSTWSATADIAHYRGIAEQEGLDLPDDLDELHEAAVAVDDLIARVPGAIGLCHNDLQVQNFLYTGTDLVLVDWEWAGMGNRYFDLGSVLVNAQCTQDEAARFCTAYFGGDVDLDVELARTSLMGVVSAVREGLWSVAAHPVLPNEWDYKAWAERFFSQARDIVASAQFAQLLRAAAP